MLGLPCWQGSRAYLYMRAAVFSVRPHSKPSSPPPQVFIPLTRLCRDSCGYCTFAQPPAAGRRCYMSIEEVVAVARLGAAQGCCEALFTLGGSGCSGGRCCL